MISWIQTSFQRHFRIIFFLLLGVTIVSFVFVGTYSNFGANPSRAEKREVFGVNLASERDIARLQQDSGLSAALRGQQLSEGYLFSRLAALHLADKLHLPPPSDPEFEKFIQELPAFRGETGSFDPSRYDRFRDSFASSPNLSQKEVRRILEQDYRAQQARRLLAGPGYVLGSEIAADLARADTRWTVAVASANYAEFQPEIAATDEIVAKFFEENAPRYQVPARVRAAAAEFKAEAYLPTVPIASPEEVKAYYEANRFRFPKPADAPKPVADLAPADPADADFAAVRPQVEQALRLDRARERAAKAAGDLTVALFQKRVPANSAELATHVSTSGAQLVELSAFTPNEPPKDRPMSDEELDALSRLGADRYFSDPVSTGSGSVVYFWRETLEAYRPELKDVRDKVVADYREQEKRRLFTEKGKAARAALETAVKAGTPFEKAAAAVKELKLTVATPAAFTRREPAKDLDTAILGALDRLEKGQLSEFRAAADKGHLVLCLDKQLPATDTTNPKYEATLKNQRAYASYITEQTVFGSLVEAEFKRADIKRE